MLDFIAMNKEGRYKIVEIQQQHLEHKNKIYGKNYINSMR